MARISGQDGIDSKVDTIDSDIDHIHDTDLPAVKTVLDDIHDTDLPAVKSVLDDIHGTDLPAVASDAEYIQDHIHAIQKVAPDLADGITVTAVDDANNWTLGSASGTILTGPAAEFDIHHIDIYDISASGAYQLNLYDDGSVVCSVSFSKASVTADNYIRVPVVTPIMAAASVITAKLASAANGGETCKVKVWYHQY